MKIPCTQCGRTDWRPDPFAAGCLCPNCWHEQVLKELHESGWEPEACNPLEDLFPIGYDGAITEDFHSILSMLSDRPSIHCDDIAERLGLDPKYVHLVLEILADAGVTEYSTSPRLSRLAPRGEALLAIVNQWKADNAKDNT